LEKELEKTIARLDLRCPSGRFDVCGPLIVARERHVRLEEELERTRRDVDRYRQYFGILLKRVRSSITLRIIPEIFKYSVSQMPQVKALYYFQKRNIVSFWIFLEEEDWDAEDQIYEIYGEMLSTFPEQDIRIRLLRLWGRKPEDLLPAGGIKILGK